MEYGVIRNRKTIEARELRKALVKELGGRCAVCRTTFQLAIDHVDGRGWQPRELSSNQRARRYWKEFHEGVRLRVLCKVCNSKRENRPVYECAGVPF